jgi:nephrocystin-4
MSPEQMLLDREDLRGHVTAQEESERPAALKSEAVRQRVISVTFSACAADGHRGPPLYVLELEVRPRPFVVDHTFRLYHGKNDFMKRKIILDTSLDVDGCSWRGGAPRGGPSWQRNLKHVWCSNPGVVIASSAASSDSDKQDIHIKYRCGEAGHEDSFYLLLYNDAWHVALYEIWHIYVTSLNRMDVEGLVGQTEPTAVMVRARDGPHPVRAFSSAPAVVSFPQPGRTIDAGLSEYPLDFHPLHPGRRDVLVHVVHAAQPPHALARRDKPLSAWLLATTARMPLISRRYDIRLPLGRVANKKILYTNPYGFAPDLSHQVLCHVANQEGSEAGAGKALPHDDANLY